MAACYLSSFTIDQIPLLLPSQISHIHIGSKTELLQALSVAQIGELTEDQIKLISFNYFTPQQLRELRPDQVSQANHAFYCRCMVPERLHALRPATLAAVPMETLSSLRPARLGSLPVEHIQSIKSRHGDNLPSEVAHALNVALLTNSDIRSITVEQFSLWGSSQLQTK